MVKKQRLVIIGNGMAGARLAEEVLAQGGRDSFEIAIFGDEPLGNYNRILLSGVLGGTQDPEDIFLNPLEWYEKNGVRLHVGVRADQIDRVEKSVYGAGDVVEPYDKLVVATGSSPFLPPMPGIYADGSAFKKGVHVFRTLDDCRQIIDRAGMCDKAAVIGGGLLGLEVACGLLNRGLEVHVVHRAPQLMHSQLDPFASAILKQNIEHMGVHIHLQKMTMAILGNGDVAGLVFEDGSCMDCDMVVIAAGVRPNVELAQQAGLTVELGIVVNDNLSSLDDPEVFAIGECAQHRGKVYGLLAPAWEQARVLADRLTGRNPRASYEGSKVSTRLKTDGVDLLCIGEIEPSEGDEVAQYSEPSRSIYKKLLIRDGRLAGAILLGDGAMTPALLEAFNHERELPENRAELLFPLGGALESPNVADLPDEAQVCNCNGISKGKIVAAVKAGHRSLQTVCDATRAGTGCGSCKRQVHAIVELAADGLMADDPSERYYVPGVPLTKVELIKACKEHGLRSVSAVFKTLAGGKEDPGSKAALASVLKTIWGEEYEDERDARFINDRVHANIQSDGTFSVVPRIFGGVVTPEQLRRLAEVAEKYNVRMVKITGGQRIDLLGIPKESLPQVWRDLGMPSGHAYTRAFRTCKTCVGNTFCRYGLGDSIGLGIEIEKRLQGVEAPHKLKLATAGCPRNCSEATTKDVGVVAIEGGKWEVYVGGAAGSRVRKGDVLCVVELHADVLKYAGRFIQYYREHAKYQERTYGFVERVGIEKLHRVLVDDAAGICQRLDAAIQAAVDAHVDPWQEAANPVHPSQFSGVLTVV
ncbi:MAG: NAD(P)/FAD-dependent oxidoreductase [Chloroflexota bacterium]|nr:MAG: NAD(P)/FAD-dependent oxidoreductase [Chloroflexota bacterium]